MYKSEKYEEIDLTQQQKFTLFLNIKKDMKIDSPFVTLISERVNKDFNYTEQIIKEEIEILNTQEEYELRFNEYIDKLIEKYKFPIKYSFVGDKVNVPLHSFFKDELKKSKEIKDKKI